MKAFSGFSAEDIKDYRFSLHMSNCLGDGDVRTSYVMEEAGGELAVDVPAEALLAQAAGSPCQGLISGNAATTCAPRLANPVFLRLSLHCDKVPGLTCPDRRPPLLSFSLSQRRRDWTVQSIPTAWRRRRWSRWGWRGRGRRG